MTLPDIYTYPKTDIPTWLSHNERQLLSELAMGVPDNGLILEIGCLYGGSTAVLALSAPKAHVVSIDDFSWTPEGYPVSSAARTAENLAFYDIKNSTILEGDSREMISHWNKKIDLLWIDGGHSFRYVYSDLYNYSKYADVIALHDYKNPAWDTIERAIEIFLRKNRLYYFDKSVDMIAVLRKKL